MFDNSHIRGALMTCPTQAQGFTCVVYFNSIAIPCRVIVWWLPLYRCRRSDISSLVLGEESITQPVQTWTLPFLQSAVWAFQLRGLLLFCFVLFYDTWFCYVAQSDLRPTIVLTQPPQCWDYKQVLPYPSTRKVLWDDYRGTHMLGGQSIALCIQMLNSMPQPLVAPK